MRRAVLIAPISVVALLVLAMQVSGSPAVASIDSACGWISIPNVNGAEDVDALSQNDAWEVGGDQAAHWNGRGWTAPYTLVGSFWAVSMHTATDVWAAGYYIESGVEKAQTAHWDGTHWQTRPVPDYSAEGGYVELLGISSSSINDAWAVGYVAVLTHSNEYQPENLIVHWNGQDWSRVPSPSLHTAGRLNDVVALSATDAWAVGEYGALLHWNGVSWQEASYPANGILYSIDARSATDVWAVGNGFGAPGGMNDTLVLHWDGHYWHRVTSPTLGDNDYLWHVSVDLAGGLWASGLYQARIDHSLVLHRSGGIWTEVSDSALRSSYVYSVEGVSSSYAWAVANGELYQYRGLCPTATPTRTTTYTRTVTPTRTPSFTRTPTYTRTRTSTKTPTATRTRTPSVTRTATIARTRTATASSTATATPRRPPPPYRTPWDWKPTQ